MPNLRTGFQTLGILARASEACVYVTLAVHFIGLRLSVLLLFFVFYFYLFFFTLDAGVLLKDGETSHHSAALGFVLSQVCSNG